MIHFLLLTISLDSSHATSSRPSMHLFSSHPSFTQLLLNSSTRVAHSSASIGGIMFAFSRYGGIRKHDSINQQRPSQTHQDSSTCMCFHSIHHIIDAYIHPSTTAADWPRYFLRRWPAAVSFSLSHPFFVSFNSCTAGVCRFVVPVYLLNVGYPWFTTESVIHWFPVELLFWKTPVLCQSIRQKDRRLHHISLSEI
jgi:hypothetical protein